MKKVLVISFLFPFLLLSQEDTLFKKRINLSMGLNLLIPQQRSTVFFIENPLNSPNSNFNTNNASSRSIYGTFIHQNGWNFSFNADVKVYKKIYFQTGINLVASFYKDYIYSDSLYASNGVWGNSSIYANRMFNFSIPLGVEYRFNKYFFAAFGIVNNFYTMSKNVNTFYRRQTINPNQEILSTSNTMNSFDITFFSSQYLSLNFRLLNFSRTYLTIKIVNTSANLLSKENLYYSIGIRFFII